MDKAARAYRYGLAAIGIAVLAMAGAFTWRDIAGDREATVAANAQLSAALAASIEAHFDAALRDSSNAALSAALLVEGAGGPAGMGGERRLHQQLHRELTDPRSTARLVLTDAAGRVLASSAEYPVRPLVIRPPARLWKVTRAGGRTFAIGTPERSGFDGTLVIPYFCDVAAADGSRAGMLRAEVRVDHFTQVYLSTAELNQAAVLVLTDDGVVLLQLPLLERHLGVVAETLSRAIAAGRGSTGQAELAAWTDDVPRYYAWRKVRDLPVAVAVGVARDAVLAGWEQRARHRMVFAWLAGAGLLLLITALSVYVGHLSTSRRQLRQVESRYWTAMENSTVGVALLGLDGTVQHANPALCRMLGYTPTELRALRSQLVAMDTERPLHADVMARFAAGGLDTFERERRLARKDGTPIWVHVQATAMRDDDSEPRNLIVHIEDITQSKEAEQALRELNESLEQRVAERTAALSRANKDLEAFSYSAAHDLRGPLGRLALFVDFLAGDLGPVEAKVAQRLENIGRQIREMNGVIDSLLTLARASRIALNPQVVDLGPLVAAVRVDLEPDGAPAVEWKVGPLHAVRADRLLLREALVNLLGNAVKYTRGREPAVIEISSQQEPQAGEVVVRIADNGAGFDMPYAADLFAPFRRLHTPAEFEGTGIGLAIVERIVERSGGRIWAHGEPDRGATFWFALPAP